MFAEKSLLADVSLTILLLVLPGSASGSTSSGTITTFEAKTVVVGIIILQAGLISGLLIKRGRQRRAIAERQESEQRLAELTGLLLRTQDEERRRIALELHDVTAQSIGLIMLNLSQVQNATLSMDQRTKDKLTESLIFGEQALKDIRTLSYVLHPPLLDQAGLVTALKWYVRGFSERSGVNVTFSEEGVNGHRMPPDVEYALFRIVQESLTNIRRHTNSETAEITVKHMRNRVRLSIRDEGSDLKLSLPRNGDGFESIGVGIPGMRHRLKQLGGELLVDSNSNGTIVTATVPVRWNGHDSSSHG
jgi:two-component system NarL family sensor kinase